MEVVLKRIYLYCQIFLYISLLVKMKVRLKIYLFYSFLEPVDPGFIHFFDLSYSIDSAF